MNVLTVTARDFRSYEEFGPWEIPDGPTAIIGQNGSGKSSILTMVDVGLFGSRSLEPFVNYQGGTAGKRLMLLLEVEHDGERYRIRRGWSHGKSVLDFERLASSFKHDEHGSIENYEPLTLGSQKDTQGLIETTLGLTRDVFRASAFIAQGDAAALTNARPAERMEILRATIGGLDTYTAAHRLAKADRVQAERDLAELAGRVTVLEQTAAEREWREREAAEIADTEKASAAALAAAEEALVTASAAIRAAQDGQTELRALAAERDTAQAAVSAAHRDRAAAAQAHREAWQAQVRERDLKQRQRQAVIAQHADLLKRASEASHRAQHLEAQGPGTERCSECAQILGVEALEANLATLRVRTAELTAAAADLQVQADAIEIPDVPDEPPDLDTAELDAAVGEALAALGKAEAAYDGAQSGQPDLAALQQTENVARGAVTNARRSCDDARSRGAVTADAIERVTQAEQALADTQQEGRRLDAYRQISQRLEEAFGPKGVPLLIVENAIPRIEDEANRILQRLGGETASCRLELRTQKTIATGEQRDTLDIVIHVPAHDTAVEYEHWSGGERTRIDLALRIGLAQLLLQAGAHVELFAVDEPEGLDVQGRAALVEIVEELAATHGFSKTLLISHDDGLRDSFSQTVRVVREDGGPSRVVGDRELVAA